MKTPPQTDPAASAAHNELHAATSDRSMSSATSRPQRWQRDAASPDYYGSSTIRTVTPESIPEEREEGLYMSSAHGRTSSRLSTSMPVSPHGNDRSPQGSSRHYRIRAGSNNELGQAVTARDQQYASLRPRTRTLESSSRTLGSRSGSVSREASPPTSAGVFMRSGNRSRMESSNSVSGTAVFGATAVEDVVTSIGHPSTIPPPSNDTILPRRKGESGKKLAKINNSRELPLPQAIHDASPPRLRPSLVPTPSRQQHHHKPDMAKILQLMKSSCGKMEGQLAFRRFETTPWALSYCNINDDTGSLVYEPKSGGPYRTLIPDIRGCNIKTAWDIESQALYLDVCPQNSKLRVHLRPHSPDEFDSWFAALLCWQPIRPKGAQNRMTKPQVPHINDRKLPDSRRHSEISLHKEPPIIKIGKMIYWDINLPSAPDSPSAKSGSQRQNAGLGIRKWQQVSSTLRENGELKLHSDDTTMSLITTVHLAQLSRCAVQRLDCSVLETEFCIAIYPQYAATANSQSFDKPIFLSLDTRVLYEVWLVLLRAFTIPQLYGPKEALTMQASQSEGRPTSYVSSTADMFRMERCLSVRVSQAKLAQPLSPKLEQGPAPRSESSSGNKDSGGYYAEILLDGEIRAKTIAKANDTNPMWRDEFEFTDLPAAVSVASIVLKKRAPNQQTRQRNVREETRKMQNALNGAGSMSGSTNISLAQIHGQIDIFLDDLESGEDLDKWWPLVNQFGQQVGEASVLVKAEESIILMAKDYQPMSELLHRFSNGLTLQIAQKIPGELRRLSDCLLNIFQVSSSASEWINSLVEEEIDGTLKDTQPARIRFNNRRMSSNENGEIRSHSPHFDRELFLRDMNKSATLEANLLFRGNTLLTKSLDLHMKRLGKEYLEDTLGDKLREIAYRDPDCEVDPNKLANPNDLDRNWRRLMKLTEDCWKCILTTIAKCPPELRYIFRHVKACAEDRYGDYIRSVRYSSVSGFLFLRFFVPAILNPHLPVFGLLKDEPRPNARRAFTLIAKSLQGLANIGTFGSKESWMEPMNAFLAKQRTAFKKFLDTLCDVSSTKIEVNIPPSYSTPLAILSRLPPTSREGFPSLPHLIDHARSFAALVTLWLDNTGDDIEIPEDQPELLKFHLECLRLRKRTEECLASAERAERPKTKNDRMWEDVVVQYDTEESTLADEGNVSTVSTSSSTLPRHNFHHSRADSVGTTPSTITSSKQTFPPILGIRSNSTVSPAETSLSSRPHQWRGPGRQLSLEILPSSRSNFVREQVLSASTSKAHPSYDTQQAASPASNTTSPFGTSPFGGSDGSADELTKVPAPPLSRSGRATPSQYPRNAADVRIHPWSYSVAREMAMRGSEDRDRSGTPGPVTNTPSSSAAATRVSSSSRRHGPGEDPNAGHESSDGGTTPGHSIGGTWRTRSSGERIFIKSDSRPQSASGPRTTPLPLTSASAARQHLRERAELMEPGDHHHHASNATASSSTTATATATPTATAASTATSSQAPRSSTPSRQPRRDWAAGDERRRRDERTAGIGRPSLQPRTHSDDVVGYQSAGETTGDDEFEGEDETGMTALPSMQRTKGEKEKKLLLKEMIFKKRKPQ